MNTTRISRTILRPVSVLLFGILCATAQAADDARGALTPVGAERSGNAEKTIPEWTGGIASPPPGYARGSFHPDPYSKDEPLFVIDGASLARYEAKLSPGQKALLERYPEFKMKVFPTRRSAALPQRIYDAIQSNSRTARLDPSGNAVHDAIGGSPFPTPKNGAEAIWNYLLRYRGDSVRRFLNQAAVTESGRYSLVASVDEIYSSYGQPGATPEGLNNVVSYFKQWINAPARLSGNILLVHETFNQVREPRRSWIYIPGQRRVVRAPYVAYDSPPASADGLRTFDQFDMYNGAIDRYEWTLVGKQEMYVPYNSYTLHSDKILYTDILKPHHINSDLARYELHRVWKVEAALRPGASHIYAKRVFYLDEDSWQIVVVDYYDSDGKLWRVSEGHPVNYYEVPVVLTTLEVHYDLPSSRYLVLGLDNEEKPYEFNILRTLGDYTPAALRQDGVK